MGEIQQLKGKEREGGDKQEGGEQGEAKRVRPNRSDVSGERRKEETNGWLRIVSKEGDITLWWREVGLGDRQRRWTGLRCLTLICIFYDASSCQNTRSLRSLWLDRSCVFLPRLSHYVHLYILVLSLTCSG